MSSTTHADERGFMSMIARDLERFNHYFIEKEEELVIRFQMLRDGLAELVSSSPSSPISHSASR